MSRLLQTQLLVGLFSLALVITIFYLLFSESRRLQDINTRIEARVRERTQQLDRAVMELREEISTRRKAEDNLKSTQTFLDLIIEHIPVMVFVKNAADQRYVLINRAGEQFMEMVGSTIC